MSPPASTVDFTRLIRAGDVVLIAQGTAEPPELTRQLAKQAAAIGPFTCFLGATFSDQFTPECLPDVGFRSYGAIGTSVALAKAGRLDVVAWDYSRLDQAFATGVLRADVVLLQLAPPPPGQAGFSLTTGNDYAVAAARQARLVVAEVNQAAPWTHGATLPDDIVPQVWVETSSPLVALQPVRFGPTEAVIAHLVAGLVPEGACLQFGVGAMPVAALSALREHRDLSIHSGVFGDICVDLIEAGAITNARKPFDRGISVTNTVLGTRRVFEHVHDNQAVAVRPASHTHARNVIGQLARFRAINSAIEVDLLGQVNTEVAAGRYVGAIGGQRDFVRGALVSDGGRAIVALPATAQYGGVSRIVDRVAHVTSPGRDADLIVTEHGVADLRGATQEQRAQRMIAIADPSFREGLARAWREETFRDAS